MYIQFLILRKSLGRSSVISVSLSGHPFLMISRTTPKDAALVFDSHRIDIHVAIRWRKVAGDYVAHLEEVHLEERT